MKVAVCISGQSRERRGHEALRARLSSLSPVYFLSTWDEQPNAQYVVESFEPKINELINPASFDELKQEFLNKYLALQQKSKLQEGRTKLLTDESRNNWFRMLILMDRANSLAKSDRFDYIVKIRPDAALDRDLTISDFKSLKPNQIACPKNWFKTNSDYARHYMSDQVFWGSAGIMQNVMAFWSEAPKYAASTEDLIYRKPYHSLWLRAENALRRYAELACGAEILSAEIKGTIIRPKK